jgi:SsrA-binding protein|tara:strand:- start:1694 stop:2131 length:438 start_codon:yes stop_codon:yes gene_type:complete
VQGKIVIVNKKASFKYILKKKYVAGLVLTGLQIKTIKAKKIVIENSYCNFINNELYVFNIVFGNLYAEKKSSSKIKLLLNKFELKKIQSETNQVGSTVIPTKIFTNDNGIAKIEISIAKGKKLYDKRNTIKERENKINLKRKLKS